MFGMFSVEQAVFTLASQPLRSAARSVKFFVTWQLLVTIHRRWWTLPLTEWSSWNCDRAPSWWSLISSATSKSLKCLLKISVNQYIIIIFFAKVLVSPALHHPLCLDSARLAHVSARNVVVWAPSSTQLRKTSHHNRVLPRESNWDSTKYTIVPFHVDNTNLIDIAAFYLLTSENLNFRTAIECINLSLEVWFGKHLEEVCQQSSQSCRCAMFKRMSLWSWGALED